MEKTTSQKILKVLCIIGIILNAIVLVFMVSGSALAFIGLSDPSISSGLQSGVSGTINGQTLNGAQATAVLGIVGIVAIISLALNLIACILGLRGANNPSKIGPFYYLLLVVVVLSVISMLLNLLQGANVSGNIGNLVFNFVLFGLAYNIKKTA